MDPTPDTKTFAKSKAAYKLPKIILPPFDGELHNWNGFWVDFNESVHKNVDLSNTERLYYLRQCMKTPALKSLLVTNSKNQDIYLELLETLQKRYDLPRKLHILHSRVLADLSVCKNQAEDLLEGADRIHKAVAGLMDLEQWDVKSIATSLGVNTLPSVLRTEWETLTEKEKAVPNVDRLVEFMRQKAANISHVAKKGDPAPLVK